MTACSGSSDSSGAADGGEGDPASDVSTSTQGLTAKDADVAVEAPTTELGSTVMNAVAGVATIVDVSAKAEDGQLFERPGQRVCADVLVDGADLLVDFSACERQAGSIRVSGSPGDGIQITFEDSYALGGRDVDGTVSMTLTRDVGRADASGTLVVDGTNVVLAAGVVYRGEGVGLYGDLSVSHDGAMANVALGTRESPLYWTTGGCVCPVAGDARLAVAASVASIPIDLDWIIEPDDGSDDYPVLWVPVTGAALAASAEAAFSPACGEQSVSAEVADLEVAVQTSDLEASVKTACDAGEVEQDECDLFFSALRFLPESINVTVPGAVAEEKIVAVLDPVLDQVCALEKP